MLAPLDIALGPDGDLDVTDDALHLTRWDAAGIAQRLQIRLRTDLGEYLLDTTLGVPWTRDVLGKGVSAQAVEALLRRAILATPGITRIFELTVAIDRVTRTLAFDFRAGCVTLTTGLEDAQQQAVIVAEGDFMEGELELICLVEGVGGFF